MSTMTTNLVTKLDKHEIQRGTNMKKSLVLLMVAALALFAFGCKSESNTTITDTAAPDTSYSTTETSSTIYTTETSATGTTGTMSTDTMSTDGMGGMTGTSSTSTTSTTSGTSTP